MEIARITIVKSLFEDDVVIRTLRSDDLPLVDALGMLAFSQAMIVRDYLGEDEA